MKRFGLRASWLGALAVVALAAGSASAGHKRWRERVYVPYVAAAPVVVQSAPAAVVTESTYVAPTAYVTPVYAAPAPAAYVVPAQRVRVVRPRVVVADPLVVPATTVYTPTYMLYP